MKDLRMEERVTFVSGGLKLAGVLHFRARVWGGGGGEGGKKFHKEHARAAAGKKFPAMMERGRRERERTGKSIMVSRYDIVPIPPGLRGNLAQGSIMEFPFEVVETMYA